jgi:hypothetical protein
MRQPTAYICTPTWITMDRLFHISQTTYSLYMYTYLNHNGQTVPHLSENLQPIYVHLLESQWTDCSTSLRQPTAYICTPTWITMNRLFHISQKTYNLYMYTYLNHNGQTVPNLSDKLFCVVIRSNDSDTSSLLGNWKFSTRTCHVISLHPSTLHHSYHLPPGTQYIKYITSTEYWIKSIQANNNWIYPQFTMA